MIIKFGLGQKVIYPHFIHINFAGFFFCPRHSSKNTTNDGYTSKLNFALKQRWIVSTGFSGKPCFDKQYNYSGNCKIVKSTRKVSLGI